MVAEVLTSGFRFSIITACRFSNGRNRNEMVVLIEAVSRMRDGFNCRCNDFPPISPPFCFFFSRLLLRFESGGQSPGRIFKRVEIFDLTENSVTENTRSKMPYFVVDPRWGKMSNYFNSAWFSLSCKC